ncbi:hypothetical protein SLEP1_g33888 [Rubroshorea leprosula]|uniref:Uncharacterized protein n=1 Tax=Rubroshorea leprosula TaxID=152421 RepID=A0AAV5KIB5_9ROSI|nr:hypothetical protein SLEP1_g33888 [Rubroshorea leprosula]
MCIALCDLGPGFIPVNQNTSSFSLSIKRKGFHYSL